MCLCVVGVFLVYFLFAVSLVVVEVGLMLVLVLSRNGKTRTTGM